MRDLEIVEELKKGKGRDIYLCGGGIFAGWLLENELRGFSSMIMG